jgi:hypothetical protein
LGVDHKEIYKEIEQYLLGNHPLFANPKPYDKITETPYSNYGIIFRSKLDEKYMILISGLVPNKAVLGKYRDELLDQAKSKEEIVSLVKKIFEENSVEEYDKDNIQVHKGIKEIYDYITTNTDAFMCIQDDYYAWNYNDEESNFGKPLILDSSGDDKIHQLFLDDHCSDDEDCIIDVRDVKTKECVEFKNHINKYTHKVNSYKAIHDKEYYHNVVQDIIKKNQE